VDATSKIQLVARRDPFRKEKGEDDSTELLAIVVIDEDDSIHSTGFAVVGGAKSVGGCGAVLPQKIVARRDPLCEQKVED